MFFATYIAVWATVFMEQWKRHAAFLNLWWGMHQSHSAVADEQADSHDQVGSLHTNVVARSICSTTPSPTHFLNSSFSMDQTHPNQSKNQVADVRPQFVGAVRYNPVDDAKEMYYVSSSERRRLIIESLLIELVLVSIFLTATAGCFRARVWIMKVMEV